MLSMCAHNERMLMTQEIVRSEDVQCNTEESPYQMKVAFNKKKFSLPVRESNTVIYDSK